MLGYRGMASTFPDGTATIRRAVRGLHQLDSRTRAPASGEVRPHQDARRHRRACQAEVILVRFNAGRSSHPSVRDSRISAGRGGALQIMPVGPAAGEALHGAARRRLQDQRGDAMLKISPEAYHEVSAALKQYTNEVTGTCLRDTTKATYLLHAGNFVRWIAGDFAPGERLTTHASIRSRR